MPEQTAVWEDGAVELSGARTLLTGASGGLGEAVARALSARGADLVLSGRNASALEGLSNELGARVLVCDLADRGALERLGAEAGDVDVLVANAGLPGSGTLPKLDPEEIDRVLEVNLRAPIMLARLLVPGMVERGRGHLVYVASFAGKVASPGESSIYTATKFGLRGFAHVLRSQLARKQVSVSLVTPGPIREAGMFARGGARLPPFIRPLPPDDVGRAVVKAIERDLPEVDVASPGLRAISKLSALAPAWVARRAG
jgi:short-subunit dehydrogenase